MNKKIKLLTCFSLISLVPVATIVACSNSFVSKFGEQAIENTKNYFRSQQNWSTLVQAGFISENKIKVLNPAQNFGFQTKVKSLAVNDQIGNLTIGFELSKASQKLQSEILIGGFKTNEQAKNDFLFNPFEYFNTKNSKLGFNQINVKQDQANQDPKSIVENILNANKQIDELKKYVEFDYKQGDKNTVLKKTLAGDEKLVISTIETIRNYQIENQILVKLKIINESKKIESSEFLLVINGFQSEAIKKQLNQDFLSNYANNYFLTIDSPIKINNQQNYLEQKASEIKTTADLIKLFASNNAIITIDKFLDLKDVKLKITLKNLVENSYDDSEGSLKATFDFALEGLQETIKLENQEINLFGFKIN